MHVYLCVLVSYQFCLCVSVYLFVSVCVLFVAASMLVSKSVSVLTCPCLYVCMYVCMYVCTHICRYVSVSL